MKKFYISVYFLFFAFNLKVDAQSTLIKSFDSQYSGKDYANRALTSSDGGIIIAGTIKDTIMPSLPQSGFLLKLDSSLNIVWSKEYFSGYINILSIASTDDKGYLLMGWKSSSYLNPVGSLVIKTDSSGNVQWSKVYEGNGLFNYCKTNDNGYVLTGQMLTSGNPQYSLTSVTKIDSLGNVFWNYSYVPSFVTHGAISRIVKQTYDNGYIVSGTTLGTGGPNSSQYLIKLDSIGNILWAKTFNDLALNDAFDIIITSDSGFVFAGTAGGLPSLLKTDKDGNIQWGKKYAINNQWGNSHKILNSLDGGYLMLNESLESNGLTNFLWKTDSVGTTEWIKQLNELPNESENVCFSLLNSLTDKFFIISSTRTNNNDLYVASIDTLHDLCTLSSPTFLNNPFTPTVQNAIFTKINLTQQNNVVTTTNNLFFMDSTICFSSFPTFLDDLSSNKMYFNLYPNPFISKISFIIQKQNISQASFAVKNILGQTVFSEQENHIKSNYIKTIDLSLLSNGIYLLDVIIDGERTVRKIVKE